MMIAILSQRMTKDQDQSQEDVVEAEVQKGDPGIGEVGAGARAVGERGQGAERKEGKGLEVGADTEDKGVKVGLEERIGPRKLWIINTYHVLVL